MKKFTLIELLVNTTCKIYNQSTAAALRKREGFGGEKAAGSAASLTVPTNLNTAAFCGGGILLSGIGKPKTISPILHHADKKAAERY